MWESKEESNSNYSSYQAFSAEIYETLSRRFQKEIWIFAFQNEYWDLSKHHKTVLFKYYCDVLSELKSKIFCT